MGPIIGIMVAVIGFLVALPFLPVIRGATNATNVAFNQTLTDSGMANTPFFSFMHLWSTLTIVLIVIIVVIIFVKVSRSA